MTRTHHRFPFAMRVVAIISALTAVLVVAIVPGAATPREDLEAAKEQREQIQERVEAARAEYDVISADLVVKSADVEEAETRLQDVTAALLTTRAQLDDATAHLDHVQTRLDDRAAEAFMAGPGTSVEFLLGSTTLSDLSDRIEFVGALAQSDADLAQVVRTTQYELETAKATLEHLQSKARREEAAAAEARDAVLAQFQRQHELLAQIEADLEKAEKLLTKEQDEFKDWLKAQRATDYGGGHSTVPMPAGWEDVLERCPVDGPRSFGDGFGAPRYVGGYHLHKGVDILAPSGTPIVAPFDGIASSDYNTLGGNVVFVQGRYGRVYNAHLSAYSSKSDGPVRAGDVIGYVGDTGNATGIPHNHFEFHPNVMPSSWPTSSYGYSIIEDALNPYPLLVAACG